MTKTTVRVALLLCDTPVGASSTENAGTDGSVHRLDDSIYTRFLLAALASYPDQEIAKNVNLIVDAYDVVTKMDYPSADQLVAGAESAYDVVMMTGSRHTAHDMSNPFIPPLISYIRELGTSPKTQHIKIVGFCFGHQIISLAMGGTCEPGKNGWEIGVYGCDTTEEGKYWWCGDVEGQGGDERVYVEQMHRDYVPSVPPSFHLLLTTPKYPVHSMYLPHPASTPSKPLARIFSIQGHPEFTPSIVSHMIDARSASGLFDAPTTKEARRRCGGKDGTGGEGFGRVGWAIWRVFLQILPSADEEPMDGIEENSSSGGQHASGNENGNGESSRSTTNHLENESRFSHVDKVLDRRGPWTNPGFVGGKQTKDFLRMQAKILVIGAGGLGCEILQNLALTGFSDIHVIDMDTIDISNLNRQFLFREADVGKSKAICAAEFVMKRVPGVKVTPYHNKIQDHPESFYKQFDIIVTGLDSIQARRWINATLVSMVDEEDENSLKPLIDGGTEGFKGQARVIFPTITSCYECSIDMLTPPTAYPICTIANTPRLPEHCIEWASVLEWPKVFKEKKLDTDNPDDIEWLYQKASTRAREFKIEGVTWALTQGVVKNIIPAIASTNAIIAASCCNEAFKIATTCAPFLSNYMMYVGNDSVYTFTFEHEKRPECPVCGGESLVVEIAKEWTLEQLIEWLSAKQELQITRPSLAYSDGKPLFFQAPPQLFEATKSNLEKKVRDLLRDGDEVTVTDPGLPFTLGVIVKYTE
ncbi:NEDD8-activating enzyme E1, partial [Tremellales sp. Uapishka_1]